MNETGDTKITCYRTPVQNAEDGYGAEWHPTPATNRKHSYILAEKICQALGMESDFTPTA